jgi:hypothetical protein
VRIDTTKMPYLRDARRPGVEVMPLFEDRHESVRLERWDPNADIELICAGGMEVFVLDGGFRDQREAFEPLSWLRLPPGTRTKASAGANGCRVWVKTGHLSEFV